MITMCKFFRVRVLKTPSIIYLAFKYFAHSSPSNLRVFLYFYSQYESDEFELNLYFYYKSTKRFNMIKSNYQNVIITKLRRLREEHGYSQNDIAILLGISNGHIGNIESYKTSHKYTLAQIYMICKEFNYPIEHIFLEDDDYNLNIDITSLIISKIIKYEQQGKYNQEI